MESGFFCPRRHPSHFFLNGRVFPGFSTPFLKRLCAPGEEGTILTDCEEITMKICMNGLGNEKEIGILWTTFFSKSS